MAVLHSYITLFIEKVHICHSTARYNILLNGYGVM
jgi:hypothetical protein